MELAEIIEKSRAFTPNSKKSTFSLPKELIEKLSLFCSENEINKSKFVSIILDDKLKEIKKEK